MAERCRCASVALGDVNPEVGRGERIGVSGPDGTGKAPRSSPRKRKVISSLNCPKPDMKASSPSPIRRRGE
jgi:hypothetical protein